MKRYLTFFSLLLALACAPESKPGVPISFSSNEIKLDPDGSPVTVTVVTDGAKWTVTPSHPWLIVSPDSGIGEVVVTVSAEENPKDEEREATLDFSMPSAFNGTISLVVTQAAGEAQDGGEGGQGGEGDEGGEGGEGGDGGGQGDDTQHPVSGLQYLGCYEIPAYSLENNEGASDSGGNEEYAFGPWWRYNTTNENQAIITHAFTQNGRIVRNWTALIDKNKQAPLWSAFVMHRDVFPDKNLGRGNWHEDPALPSDWQSCFASGNYHRGHLVASNYRQNTTDARNQTFLYTNQALQEQNGFNGSIWNELETKVNNSRPSGQDTLYVVVGLLYETERIMDNKPAPSHFYKLLLRCSFDGLGTMTSAKGVAYLMENDAHSNSEFDNVKYRTSIDAIEERTGFDFFASVPNTLQDAAEKQTDPVW